MAKETKETVAIRLTPTGRAILQAFSDQWASSRSAALERLLREAAKAEGFDVAKLLEEYANQDKGQGE